MFPFQVLYSLVKWVFGKGNTPFNCHKKEVENAIIGSEMGKKHAQCGVLCAINSAFLMKKFAYMKFNLFLCNRFQK